MKSFNLKIRVGKLFAIPLPLWKGSRVQVFKIWLGLWLLQHGDLSSVTKYVMNKTERFDTFCPQAFMTRHTIFSKLSMPRSKTRDINNHILNCFSQLSSLKLGHENGEDRLSTCFPTGCTVRYQEVNQEYRQNSQDILIQRKTPAA